MRCGVRSRRSTRPDERAGTDLTVAGVLSVFPGAKVLSGADRLAATTCQYCSGNKSFPPSMRRGRIVEVRWPDGRVTIQCHYCGRAVTEMK